MHVQRWGCSLLHMLFFWGLVCFLDAEQKGKAPALQVMQAALARVIPVQAVLAQVVHPAALPVRDRWAQKSAIGPE